MDKLSNLKDKPRLVLYAIAGGYLFYQGISIIASILKNGSSFSANLPLYISAVIFILSGLFIIGYDLKSIKTQLNDMNAPKLNSSDDSEYKDQSDEK